MSNNTGIVSGHPFTIFNTNLKTNNQKNVGNPFLNTVNQYNIEGLNKLHFSSPVTKVLDSNFNKIKDLNLGIGNIKTNTIFKFNAEGENQNLYNNQIKRYIRSKTTFSSRIAKF